MKIPHLEYDREIRIWHLNFQHDTATFKILIYLGFLNWP